jgi:DNA-binding LacI/PurR family transcriptional regulator
MARKRATSLEVAREAGVSRTTVSLVLNDAPGSGIPAETRTKVLEAAQQLNYYPNVAGRRLASGRTSTLAFVMHQSAERAAADLFLPEVLRGLNTFLNISGYHMLFCPSDPENRQAGYAYLIYEGYVDAIVLSGPQLEETEAVNLHNQHLPVVITGRLPGHEISYVDADNYQGAQLATNHLITLGHRRIGLITNAPRSYVSSRERYRGYQDSLMAAELFYDPALVKEGYFTSDSGYKAMNALLDVEERPTAVFVASDVVAFGALQAIKDRNLDIPGDIALVGFDDVSIAKYVEPPLTTIHLPAYNLGWKAGEMALSLIDQTAPEMSSQLLETKLVVRDSCGSKTKTRSNRMYH